VGEEYFEEINLKKNRIDEQRKNPQAHTHIAGETIMQQMTKKLTLELFYIFYSF
jgi:cysteine synthase